MATPEVEESEAPGRRSQDDARSFRPNATMEPRSKLWVERDGAVALSDWRMALLEGVESTGSLAKAAERMGVPYRTAWQKLKDTEERLGAKLVDTQSGGADGGGSVLTGFAKDILQRYHQFSEGLAELVDRRFAEAFGDLSLPKTTGPDRGRHCGLRKP